MLPSHSHHTFLTQRWKDYDLSAVFMRNWDTRDESGTDKGCEWEKDWEDVQRVCKTLDLPCRMVSALPALSYLPH
jgi:tRNA U34 2-thiouridine synthase MnmA/TrmU